MAKRINIEVVDDLDGSEAASTTQLSFDGRRIEIDLSEKNRSKLEKVLDPYLQAGRRKVRAKSGRAETANGYSAKEVRAWAQTVGIAVPDRGRIPKAVIDQYYEAK